MYEFLDHDMALKHLRRLLKRKNISQSETAAIIKMVANANPGINVDFNEYFEGLSWAVNKIRKWPERSKDLMTPLGEWFWKWHDGPKGKGFELHLQFEGGDEYIIQKKDWWQKKDDY